MSNLRVLLEGARTAAALNMTFAPSNYEATNCPAGLLILKSIAESSFLGDLPKHLLQYRYPPLCICRGCYQPPQNKANSPN